LTPWASGESALGHPGWQNLAWSSPSRPLSAPLQAWPSSQVRFRIQFAHLLGTDYWVPAAAFI